MTVLLRILSSTPPWVFALLAYFVWQGVRALQVRTVPVWRALIVPGLFILLGVSRIVSGGEAGYFAGWSLIFIRRYRTAA